ncbi:DDE superfamily endonuclease domain-containing protein [Hirsutella rhossiliensis]|uniref:DDE superfamily endonuclease domain-containing protein n=1 Tax=Hirsutella rhossiliensis TaxID=111463 RepID=A0A9P8SE88_9HYPO|nr:DDE superfamily endonuclease domain-containing protein [Hirsutella rhossiliensis]KAH0957786.1 DDE superfamily endonuclease domain-containing protein [Hirsutella rhossiliensis]
MDETGFRIGESATAIEAISAGGAFIPAFLILSGQMHMTSCLEWLQHFDKHSAKTSRSSKRLLILDGHGSHHTRQFIQYCDEHGIIPFGMPPNLTHLLQPLDVVVFQPLKHYHAKALEVMLINSRSYSKKTKT